MVEDQNQILSELFPKITKQKMISNEFQDRFNKHLPLQVKSLEVVLCHHNLC